MYLRLLSWFLNCVCLSFVLQFDNVLVQPDGRGTLCLVARLDQNFWMNRIVRFDVRIGFQHARHDCTRGHKNCVFKVLHDVCPVSCLLVSCVFSSLGNFGSPQPTMFSFLDC
jgi:hypothetical protein